MRRKRKKERVIKEKRIYSDRPIAGLIGTDVDG